jgi:hypothetical protein
MACARANRNLLDFASEADHFNQTGSRSWLSSDDQRLI